MKSICKALFGVVLLVSPTRADEKVEQAITEILYDGVPEFKIRPYRAHPLLHNAAQMHQTARALKEVGEAYPSIGPAILIAVSYREATFNQDARSIKGARSGFQIMPEIARYVKTYEARCNLKTYRGAAFCAAAWLKRSREKCGSNLKSHVRYLTGSCQTTSNKIQWRARDRIRLAEYVARTYLRDKLLALITGPPTERLQF